MQGLKNIAGLVIPVVVLGLLALPTAARAQGKDDDALKQLDAAKLTLSSAIKTAETASKGKALAAHVANSEVIVYCEVNGKCMEVPVDIKKGTAGKVVEATAKEEKGSHLTKPKEVAKALDDGKQTLAKVIEAAETSAKGKAIAARPKLEGDKLDYSVRVKAGDKWESVTVDGKTGKVTKAADKAEKKAEQKAEKKAEKKPAEPKKQ